MQKMLLIIPLIMLLTACDSGQETASQTADQKTDTQPHGGTVAEPNAESEGEEINAGLAVTDTLNIDSLNGTWEVIGVATLKKGVSVFSKNDPLILKSKIKIDDQNILWASTASDEFTADDICKNPVPVKLDDQQSFDQKTEITEQNQFQVAAMQLEIKSGNLGPVYSLGCEGGGNWGPLADGGSSMVMLGKNRMLMSWYDNSALLLRR